MNRDEAEHPIIWIHPFVAIHLLNDAKSVACSVFPSERIHDPDFHPDVQTFARRTSRRPVAPRKKSEVHFLELQVLISIVGEVRRIHSCTFPSIEWAHLGIPVLQSVLFIFASNDFNGLKHEVVVPFRRSADIK